MAATRKTARGYISVVQEQRFRLTTDAGQSFLLTLARDAACDIAEVHRFRVARGQVVVMYEGEPGLASGVAYDIKPAR